MKRDINNSNNTYASLLPPLSYIRSRISSYDKTFQISSETLQSLSYISQFDISIQNLNISLSSTIELISHNSKHITSKHLHKWL